VSKLLRIGEVARAAGLTVRTLHHYDEIGLLTPSHRTAAGYRLYDGRDVVRLQQIVSLRQLGLTLDEIRDFLARPDASAKRVVTLHLSRLREQLERQHALVRRLETLEARLGAAEDVSVDEFLFTIEAITMYEKYFTPEQRERLAERERAVGRERIEQVQQEWPALIARVREEMAKGTDPGDPIVAQLAAQWMALVEEFTGGDAGLARSVGRLYQEEPAARQYTGLDAEIMDYIARARAASAG
jgi:DNA-binding transcriptional MerR regulator